MAARCGLPVVVSDGAKLRRVGDAYVANYAEGWRIAELLLQAGAQPESAAGHLLRVAPRADSFVLSTLCGATVAGDA